VYKHIKLAQLVWRFHRFRNKLKQDPNSAKYSDISLTADREEIADTLEVLHAHVPPKLTVIKDLSQTPVA
jgi:hypothetical protein